MVESADDKKMIFWDEGEIDLENQLRSSTGSHTYENDVEAHQRLFEARSCSRSKMMMFGCLECGTANDSL